MVSMTDKFFDIPETPEEKITRAKAQLMEDNPFWGYLALRLKPQKTETEEEVSLYGKIPTMAVDYNGNLLYNPKWVMKLTDKQAQFAIAHEISHVAFFHNVRFPFWGEIEQLKKDFQDITEDNIKKLIESKSKWLMWNIAGDVCINNILMGSGFEAPEGLYSSKVPGYEKYANQMTEEVFDDLQKDPSKKIKVNIKVCGGMIPGMPGDKNGKGGGKDSDKPDIEFDRKIKEWEKAVVEAATIAQRQGKLPGALSKWVDILIEPPTMNWWSILNRFITRMFP